MNATLGDPFLLASYGLPSISKKGKGKEKASDERHFIFASHSSVPNSDDGQVTLAVQGDGIHIFELGDLHPVSSHALGPSTSFASSPVTQTCSEGEGSVRWTYAAIQSAQDLKKEDSGRVVWAWKEQVAGDVGSSQDKLSTKLSHDVSHLVALRELNSIVAVSGTGSFTRLDLDLNVKNSWSPENDSRRLIKLFEFPRRDCRFIPGENQPNGSVLVVFVEDNANIFLQSFVLGPEEEMSISDPLELPLENAKDIIDISCSSVGNMSILTSNGTWMFYLLEVRDGLTSISPGSSPLQLRSLTFTSGSSNKVAGQVSLLSLRSSFVLLAGITSKEIALLLWDIQYGVLLHSVMLPIPAGLENSANALSVHLSPGSTSQAILVLSPTSTNTKRNSQFRSNVWLVPFSVPERSTIALAMGKAAQGSPWLASNDLHSPSKDGESQGKEAMLRDLREAVEMEQWETANDVFFNWLKRHEPKAQNQDPSHAAADGTATNEQRDVEMTEGEVVKGQDSKRPPLKSILDHAFVARILSIILQSEGQKKHYSPKIVRCLVTRYLVSHSMVACGLLQVLVELNDWETIRECFTYVVDLPENELIRLLQLVVKHHRNQATPDDDIMLVDKPKKKSRGPWNEIPSVITFLTRVVDCPAAPAAWRVALREHFADVENLMVLLTICDEWLRVFTEKDLSLALGEVSLNEHSIPVPVQPKAKKSSRQKIPSLENLLTFLQAILDSSFLTLLQNPASHALLQSISENVSLIQAENLGLVGLCGPLDPFARVQRKSLADAASGGKKRDEVDWQKRRKQAHEQAAISLGPYQDIDLFFVNSLHYFVIAIYNFIESTEAVSDTASRDASADKSGPLVKELVTGKGFEVVNTLIVSDEEQEIRQAVVRWSASGDVDWIITTGGTGFGVRDRTPEAIKPLIEREAAGIIHLLLSASLSHTPLAALSRPIAGTVRGSNTLVVTLPGSTKAVRENISALIGTEGPGIGVIGHALELLRGGSGREVHSALARGENPVSPLKQETSGIAQEHDCGHHHHHHEHRSQSSYVQADPSSSVAARHRISPFPLISYEAALGAIFHHIPVTDVVKQTVTSALKGSVLAEDVYASHDIPATQTTNMDGYAVRSSDAPGVYQVLTPQTHALAIPLPTGNIYRINTGAPLPAGTDSIVIVEDTQLVSSTADNEEKEVRTLAQVKSGENVRAPGSDVRKGDLVLSKGEIISGTGGEIGTLAFVGRKEVSVFRRPVIAVMSTGNELVDLQGSLEGKSQSYNAQESWSGIWDTNRPSLKAALETMGYEVIDLGIVKDDTQSHIETLRSGLQRADLVLTTGGTSMGASDLLKPVIEKHLGGTIHFGRVTIKPGKPTTFATIPVGNEEKQRFKPVFALPGNPASALVCFYIFVVPALRKLGGWPISKCQLPRVRVQLADSMRLDPRTEFHRVVIGAGPDGLLARSTGGQRSSRVASLSGANGLVVLPQKKEGGPAELKAGEIAEAILIGEIVMD
ncbi:uncharacterized protein FOMMEDRAFT_147908 [Fomitiporia mediterranea MF3/22]|uniref:uncharacterized protein n=1 Tax=Fomitiporia mediterranea (strain MF3/22) TaxID=694068 RepID=UPI00044093C6|nr:uncharacterized protein FOMMEDRAFT_147908 [Fomitiporia mediterranea MF3/22]EJD01356.1 hypothetical protein FOMMEDRAFT_147908 [Fomitiporia mediterranea MF3/22]